MKKVEMKQKLKRKEIALKSIALIDEKGFSNVTVNDLCKSMDIAVGTFYHYFKDKNEIIKELFMLIDDYFKEVVNKDVTVFDNELLNARLFCDYFAYFSYNCGHSVCRIMAYVPLYDDEGNMIIKGRYTPDLLLKILDRAVEKGQITKDVEPTILNKMLLNMVRGYSAAWGKHNGNFDILKLTDDNVKLYLKVISNDDKLLQESLDYKIEYIDFDWLSLKEVKE